MANRSANDPVDVDRAVEELGNAAVSGPMVVVLRGVAGSGKSHLCASLCDTFPPGAAIAVSADAYFQSNPDGSYKFDVRRLVDAHAYCRRAFDSALRQRVPVIIVDNTNTEWWEYAPYVAAVDSYNSAVRAGRVAGVPWPQSHGAADRTTDEVGWSAAGFVSADVHARNIAPGTPRPRIRAQALKFASGASSPGGTSAGDLRGTYRTLVVEFACPNASVATLFAQRNTHDVPVEAVLRMWYRLCEDPDPTTFLIVRAPELSQERSARSEAPRSARGQHSLVRSRYPSLPPWSRALATLASRVVYVGLFLSTAGRDAVLSAFPPLHTVVFADHVTTMHHPPRNIISPPLLEWIGTEVELLVGPAFADEHTHAAIVQWPHHLETRSRGATTDNIGKGVGTVNGRGTLDAGADSPDRLEDFDAPGVSPLPPRPGKIQRSGPSSAAHLAVRPQHGGAHDTSGFRSMLQRLLVNGLSTNAVPHVTLSTREGVPPSASNSLLGRSLHSSRSGNQSTQHGTTDVPVVAVHARFGLALVDTTSYPARREYVCTQAQLRAALGLVES